MSSTPWAIYDGLIAGIPKNSPVVVDYQLGLEFATVLSDEDGFGMGMTFPVTSRPQLFSGETLVGKPLSEVAQLVKSWNFVEAGIGLAAINAFYN